MKPKRAQQHSAGGGRRWRDTTPIHGATVNARPVRNRRCRSVPTSRKGAPFDSGAKIFGEEDHESCQGSRAGCAARRYLLRRGRRRRQQDQRRCAARRRSGEGISSQGGLLRNLSWAVGARLHRDESYAETRGPAAGLYKEPITGLHRAPSAEPRDGQCGPCPQPRDGRRPGHTFQGSRPAALWRRSERPRVRRGKDLP